MGRKKGTPSPNKGKYKFPVQPDGTKECRDCHRMLPLSKYSKGDSAGGKQINCKDCQSSYYGDYQEKQRKLNKEAEARGEYRVTEKQCPWCGGTFGPEAFSRDVSRADGLQWCCKQCASVWGRYHYYRPKPQRVKWEDVEAQHRRADEFKEAG